MLAERGIDASYETVRRWFLKFGPSIAANIRRSRPRPSDHWHLDEMVISIRSGKYWLWRAVDNEGEVLDFLVQRRRDAQAAKKLMVKLLKKRGLAPSRVVTDRLRSYPAAFRAVGITAEHDRGLKQPRGELASADTTPRTKTAAVQITRLSPTFPRHPCRHIQRIHPSTSSAAPTAFQGASRRFIPHLGRGIRHRMTPVARYIHHN